MTIFSPIIILFGAAALIIILLLIFIIISLSNRSKLKKIMRNCKSGNLAQTIEYYYDKVGVLGNNISKLSENFSRYEQDNMHAMQKTGIVNFDAFDDTHGKLSFTLAVLNRHNDGYILTSIYSHDTSNIYVRRVSGGKSDTHLLPEENDALQKAISSY